MLQSIGWQPQHGGYKRLKRYDFFQRKFGKFLLMKKVLLINDDPDFQFLIKSYLERKGYLAETIDMTDDVISFVEEFKPDVIIVDMKMETDKGICSQLRQKLKLPAKLVLLSDQSVKPTTLHICKPDVILPKPFEPEELIKKIAM